jgi:hypothetical protein
MFEPRLMDRKGHGPVIALVVVNPLCHVAGLVTRDEAVSLIGHYGFASENFASFSVVVHLFLNALLPTT